METIVLAGGFGSRLSEYTDIIPKPMVTIGDKPILEHILNHYSNYGHNSFYLALGYKAEVIKDYFLKYNYCKSNLDINLSTGEVIETNHKNRLDWKIYLRDTGNSTLTGGRLKRLEKDIKGDTFMLTYGDGLCDIDINKLINYHFKNGKICTITAVRPQARFGLIEFDGDKVIGFEEKSQTSSGWINGGYMVMNREIFNFIEKDDTVLEKDTLKILAETNNLTAFKHEGFWHCMDTKRDRDNLQQLNLEGKLFFN